MPISLIQWTLEVIIGEKDLQMQRMVQKICIGALDLLSGAQRCLLHFNIQCNVIALKYYHIYSINTNLSADTYCVVLCYNNKVPTECVVSFA